MVGLRIEKKKLSECFRGLFENKALSFIHETIFGELTKQDIGAKSILDSFSADVWKVLLVVYMKGINTKGGKNVFLEAGIKVEENF